MTDVFTSRPATRTCGGCGDELAAASRFCGYCGSSATAPSPEIEETTVLRPVEAVPTAVTADTTAIEMSGEPVAGSRIEPDAPAAPDARRRRPRPRTLALVALGTLVVLVLAVLVADDVRQRGDLDRTRTRLASTQRALDDTKAELAATIDDLESAEADLASTRRELAASEKTVASLRQQLSGVRNSLSDAKGKVEVQATQIVTLKTCLDGVSLALSDVAYGDYSSAVAALDAVRVSCEAASRIVA